MRKYLREAPWGIGVGMNRDNVPKNNKYTLMSSIPPDSHYVFVWIHTGKIGLITFKIAQKTAIDPIIFSFFIRKINNI